MHISSAIFKNFLGGDPSYHLQLGGIPPPTLSPTHRFAARKCPFYNVHSAFLNPGWSTGMYHLGIVDSLPSISVPEKMLIPY